MIRGEVKNGREFDGKNETRRQKSANTVDADRGQRGSNGAKSVSTVAPPHASDGFKTDSAPFLPRSLFFF